jgi:hypothetical protein
MFGNKYYKCISVDEPIPQRDCYFIINTDVLKGNGIHWCSGIIRGKTIYVYDSFGRKTNKILKIFHSNARKHGYSVRDTEYDPEQKGGSSCGHRCIAGLKIADKYGIKAFMNL